MCREEHKDSAPGTQASPQMAQPAGASEGSDDVDGNEMTSVDIMIFKVYEIVSFCRGKSYIPSRILLNQKE